MFGVAAMENMNLVCDVNAFPKDLTFHWRFNNSGDEEFDLDNFMSNGTRSILTFSPMTKRDYGTILCFANNEVGRQRKACLFQIVPAGKNQVTARLFLSLTLMAKALTMRTPFSYFTASIKN